MIRLVVSDVDGTLVTKDKRLTPPVIATAGKLAAAGIKLALVSSRPPRGMAFLRAELGIDTLLAGFNGGAVQAADGSLVSEDLVPEAAAREAVALCDRHGVAAWLFADDQWLLRDPAADYVAKEQRTVRFAPTPVDDLSPFLARCGKIVGVSADFALLGAVEAEMGQTLEGRANARRSQPYYLDVTNPGVDKGTALCAIAAHYGIDPADTAAIGDMENDVPMFRAAGLSIAMGNAPPAVAAQAAERTDSNEQDGWARAIGRLVLAA